MEHILLDRNENQYGPSPMCYEALRKANLEDLSLYSRAYLNGTKGVLSVRLSEELGIPEDQLLLGYGSEDLLKQTVHCFLGEGETMLLPRQSWWYYHALAGEVSARHDLYSLREENGSFAFDLDQILSLYDQARPSVILIASPNNPTGNSIPPEALQRLVDHCASSVIILDQAYHGEATEEAHLLRQMLGAHTRLVVLRTFSKYYALAGLRIGYACVSAGLPRLIAYSARYLGYNRLSERLALAALEDTAYYRRIHGLMEEDKQRYMRLFALLPGFTAFRSDANFLLVRYPRRRRAVLKEELGRRRITVKFLDDPGFDDCMRISIGTREQNARVMAALREIEQPARSSTAILPGA